MSLTRITQLTEHQTASMDDWADRWIEIGLRTGAADRERFEASARACYRYTGLDEPKRIIWVSSPLVMALAAPITAAIIAFIRHSRNDAVHGIAHDAVRGAVSGAVNGAVRDAVRDAVDDAVDDAVSGAVDDAVRGAVRDAVNDAVNGAVNGAVRGAVNDAVNDAVNGAVNGAVNAAVNAAVNGAVNAAVNGTVRDAVRDAVDDAVDDAVGSAEYGNLPLYIRRTIASTWWRYMGGQLSPGGYWYGGAWTSFFRDVCHLDLPGDTWDRARAYEGTIESACTWWPHREFIMVSERPLSIHRELVDPERHRGWASHRLHSGDRAAIIWPDGWGVWAWHGVRVPQHVIESPESITIQEIVDEQNVEIRRVMIERAGPSRVLREIGAHVVSVEHVPCANAEWCHHSAEHHVAILHQAQIDGDEPLTMVEVVNSTPEPDGSWKTYFLRVPPSMRSARQAVAWTFGLDTADEYQPVLQS